MINNPISRFRVPISLGAAVLAFVVGNSAPRIKSTSIVKTESGQRTQPDYPDANIGLIAEQRTGTRAFMNPGSRRRLIQQFFDKKSSEYGPIMELCAWVNSATADELIDCLEDSAGIVTMDIWPRRAFDGLIFEKLGQVDPASGLEMVDALGHERFSSAYTSLITSWGKSHPAEAARNVLNRIKEKQELSCESFSSIFLSLAKSPTFDIGPVLRETYFSTNEDGKEAVSKFQGDYIYHQFSDNGDELELPKWIEQSAFSEENRQEMYSNMIRQCAAFGREDAVLYAAKSAGQGISAWAAQDAVRAAASYDFYKAVEFAASLPPGGVRSGAFEGLSQTDKLLESGTAFVDWFSKHPPSPDFDLALEHAANRFIKYDIQLAWKTSMLITSSTSTIDHQRNKIANKWLGEDFDGASRALPAEHVDRFRKARPLLQQLGKIMGHTNQPKMYWE